jgi:hypothetical protein
MRSLLVLAIVCAGGLVTATGGLAGQPVTQTLIPAPPSFYTCKADGNGTLCEGSIASEYGPFDTGNTCGSGPSAFDVFYSASENEVARRVYDASGLLVRRNRHDRYSGQLSNPATGIAIPFTEEDEIADEFAVPGDLGSMTRAITGQIHIRSANGGAPVLIGAGRLVFGADGRVEFEAGPSGFFDWLTRDPAANRSICAGLGV